MKTVVLVDGEHYPPVTAQAIEGLSENGYSIVAAVYAGGGEKLSVPIELHVPLVTGDGAIDALTIALREFAPDVVYELSDDPVIDHAARTRLAAVTLAAGVAYHAPGLVMTPPQQINAGVPTIAVIGTGKRCGKTAVSAHLARTLRDAGITPVVVAMGRGGPAEPVVVRGDREPPDAARLSAIAHAGEHAASDVYEDAVVAGVAVVGARRAGAGPSGATGFDTVEAALKEALTLAPDVVLLEGSGTAIPPVRADATVLVARHDDDPDAWPLVHRLLLADLVVVRMPSDKVGPVHGLQGRTPNDKTPGGVAHLVQGSSASASRTREQASVVPVTLHATPMSGVNGRIVFVATTAPEAAGDAIRAQLQQVHGAHVAGITHHLAERPKLAQDMSNAAGTYEVLVCEIKAAAVDVAMKAAHDAGAGVVFLDNRPQAQGGNLEDEILKVARTATQRFATR